MIPVSMHGQTGLVVELVTQLARADRYVGTRDLAALTGVDRTSARRALIELATRDWVLRRDRDGGNYWRRGPVVEDASRTWMRLAREAHEEASAMLAQMQDPIGPDWRPLPPQREVVPGILPREITHHAHAGTAAVCAVMELLVERGRYRATAADIAGVLGLHRVTATAILDELVHQAWAQRSEHGGPHQYRLGPGLPRLGQHVPAHTLSSPMVVGAGVAGARGVA